MAAPVTMLRHASEQLVRTYASVLQESLAEEIIAFPSLLRNCGSHMRQHDCWLKQKIAPTFPNVEVAQRALSLFIFSVVQLQWLGFAVTAEANKERVVFENGTWEKFSDICQWLRLPNYSRRQSAHVSKVSGYFQDACFAVVFLLFFSIFIYY